MTNMFFKKCHMHETLLWVEFLAYTVHSDLNVSFQGKVYKI